MLRAIFQSTLPRGERLAQQYEWDSITVISIHAPTRGATERGRRYFRTTIISIHAPTRGATPCRQKKSSMQIFQSTLPRGERQCCRGKLQLRNEISIHAPTRGATIPSKTGININKNFNPHSHEGSDTGVPSDSGASWISIHAPTRGATPEERYKDLYGEISIHAPTRGATDFLWCLILPFRFQSTLPRGERLVLCSIRSGM